MTAEPGFTALADLQARAATLPSCPAWSQLGMRAHQLQSRLLRDLLDEPQRFRRFSRRACGLQLDFSRQRLDEETLVLLLQLAQERQLPDWIGHLFAGSPVNNTEHRPALHMALRSRERDPLLVAGADIRPAVRDELERVLGFARSLRSGEIRGCTGQPIRDVVNIGIGGSDLGLVMVTEALREFCTPAIRCHFVSNIDGGELARALPELSAATTLFIICSKSFTTLETRLNAMAARNWFVAQAGEEAVAGHFAAISVNAAAMDEFGIAPRNRFRIWDWVGGRYSLWSAVGLSVAIALGPDHFRALLDGAADMDEHFHTAPLGENLPVLLGLLGVWNQNFLGAASHVVLPYTQALHRFPAFLQQLEMESNGKGVTRDGRPVAWPTGGVVWGEPGSNAQHAFCQLLHQGTAVCSADFIAPLHPAGGPRQQHLAGLANMLAQAEVLARGRTRAEVNAGAAASAEAAQLSVHKVHPGGRPGTLILLDTLEPRHLGALIALYEHKVFVQSVIWGINPFDQWGVEFGKQLATRYAEALETGDPQGLLPGIAADIVAAMMQGTE